MALEQVCEIPCQTSCSCQTDAPLSADRIAFGVIEVLDALVALFGNVFMGWLRDVTGSYHTNMFLIFALAVVGWLMLVALLMWDRMYLQSRLNKGRSRMRYQALGEAEFDEQTSAVLAMQAERNSMALDAVELSARAHMKQNVEG